MPLIINRLPKQEDKEIVMGKQPVADYYPPGATEPIVRPANVPAPNENPEGVVVGESKSISNAVEGAKESFHEDVAKKPSGAASKGARKK
jgi:hypothetical protein